MYHNKLHGSLVELEHASALLKGNPLGDPHVRTFPVYLPPGYHDTDQAYPVIYALAAFTGTGLNMPNFSVWEESLPEQLDGLIATGACPPAILVMPDCFTALGGSQYVNSTATGPYEDYLITELIPFVDDRLRTLPERDRRGVLGKSSGGYGALTLAMQHPDVFSAAACHSGDMYFEYGYLKDFPTAVNALNRAGGIAPFLEQFAAARQKGPLIPTLNIIAMAAAYSPNGTRIDLPFALPTGELLPQVWDRWLARDPVRLVDRHADALKQLKLLFIDAGEKDEFALHLGARILVERLKAQNIPHQYEEHDGGHFGINHRCRVSLERMAKVLAGNP